MRAVRLTFPAIFGLAVLVACVPGLGDCDMKPLGALPVAAIGPPPAPITGPPTASCASMVEFGGRVYSPSGDAGTWTVTLDDLEPIGVATAANEPAWENTTVFAISGVEPQHAIAMQYGSGATITVLLGGEAQLPDSMCSYMARPQNEPICQDDG